MGFEVHSPFYSDGYKVGHKRMLASGVKRLYGTEIPRSTKHAPKGINKIVSFGQQMTWVWLNDQWNDNFFSMPLNLVDNFAKDMCLYLSMEYNADHFAELHTLGYLPMRVKALPEGIETDANIPHMTFINTVDGFGWLTLYLETVVSSLSWKSSTSATLALQYKRNAVEWVQKTDPENTWLVDYMCHDFSARGLDPWTMISSGLGHATSHRGSDTLVVIPAARYFYDEPEDEVCINSVNASEHSVSTTKIFTVGEKQMIIDWLKEFPTGILSIVADTFDLWKLLTEYIASPEVKELIMARDGKLVIRPDSGDPVDITCGKRIKDFETEQSIFYYLDEKIRDITPHGECGGDISEIVRLNGKLVEVTYDPDWNRHDKQFYYIDNWGDDVKHLTFKNLTESSSDLGVIEILWNEFGGTTNEQGYKVLDPHIGAIYGDSITLDRQISIYSRLAEKGFASTNIVLGVGSYTYQLNTRDTLGRAVKGGWFSTDEGEYNIYKDPITDDGTKKSPKGFLQVWNNNPNCQADEFLNDGNDDFKLRDECTKEQENAGLLQVIFEDGNFINKTTLTEVRARLDKLVKNS